MAGGEQLENMIDWVYEGQYQGLIADMMEANPDLCETLLNQTSNTYIPSNYEHWSAQNDLRISHLAGVIMRCKNEHVLTPFTLLFTLAMKHKSID